MKVFVFLISIVSFLISSDITVLENQIKSGSIKSKLELGLKYIHGDSVTMDIEKGFSLVSESAKKGYPKAKLYLAYFYEKGIGTQQDYNEAVRLYSEASKQGEMEASFNLATIYHYGENNGRNIVTDRQDFSMALKFYRLSLKQGKENFLVRERLNELCSKHSDICQ